MNRSFAHAHTVPRTLLEIELIDLLVRQDRSAVSSAVLAVAGIGAGEATRRAVLARVGEAAGSATAQGAISAERGAEIARAAAYTAMPIGCVTPGQE